MSWKKLSDDKPSYIYLSVDTHDHSHQHRNLQDAFDTGHGVIIVTDKDGIPKRTYVQDDNGTCGGKTKYKIWKTYV